MEKVVLSALPKTWIFDLDGTLVVHNGYKTGEDRLLPGVKDFLDSIPAQDFILILTGREEEAKEKTLKFFRQQGLRYDDILFEMPLGERILFNDKKPSGLNMSHAVNLTRDGGLSSVQIDINGEL